MRKVEYVEIPKMTTSISYLRNFMKQPLKLIETLTYLLTVGIFKSPKILIKIVGIGKNFQRQQMSLIVLQSQQISHIIQTIKVFLEKTLIVCQPHRQEFIGKFVGHYLKAFLADKFKALCELL